MLIWSGEEGIELVSTWSLTGDEKKKLSTYWKKFEEYVAPKSNFRLSRYKLRTLKQEPGETVDYFLKKVRILVKECKYTSPNEHIIDALIFESNNPRVQSKLLEHDATLTLDKAIDTARTQEATSNQLQDKRGSQDTTVNALRHIGNTWERPAQDPPKSQETRCGHCGNFHDMSAQSLCPAHGTRCKACGKWNHWSQVCRSTQKTKTSSRQAKRAGQEHKQRQGINALESTEPDVDAPTGGTPYEVLPKLDGAKYFSIIDARSGYWNIQLDHQSSLYTTFNSPHGRYRFLRLPFGLICAQDIFQKKVDETFGDLPGVTGIADDIIVCGYKGDHSDNDASLRAVMKRARETGLRFNADKCKIRCSEIPLSGHIISASDLRPDSQKMEAIEKMDSSGSLADLQSFLGMTQFLSELYLT
ncbi:hypothetical protein ACROYT_G017970 [Oculina patagonica]